LDFFQEASNTETIGANLRQFYKNNEVQTPQIYWEYSSLRMLTMEFIEGENIELFFTNRAENLLSGPSSEETELSALDRERKYLSKIITNSFLHQIFIDGFFHADPHPGNLLLVFDPKQGHMRVVLLDFGMVGRVDPRSRTILIDFLLAIIKFDSRRATDRIMEFGKAPADINRHQFAQDLDHILRSTLGRPLREVQVGKILQDILDMTMRYRIQLPGIFITLLRVLITTEGICRQLDRDYILIQAAEPFVVQAIKNQFLQTFTLRDMARVGLELSSLLTALPRQLDDFLVNLNSGRVQFINEHRNLEGLERALRVLGNRIAAGLLVCGLSVSSAISLVLPAGPKLFGIPLLSMGLFTLSTLLGMWLLNGINRRE
jgi:ubiquinone biosynthesis protein